MNTKTCLKCGQEKLLDAYGARKISPDGLRNHCLECVSAYSAEWRKRNADAIEERMRAYHKLPQRRQAHRAYLVTHPNRVAAARAVKMAIKKGLLSRLPCFVCGNDKTHAHHSDYSNPLGVTWLCRNHHLQLHREHRIMEMRRV